VDGSPHLARLSPSSPLLSSLSLLLLSAPLSSPPTGLRAGMARPGTAHLVARLGGGSCLAARFLAVLSLGMGWGWGWVGAGAGLGVWGSAAWPAAPPGGSRDFSSEIWPEYWLVRAESWQMCLWERG
jgi:hypothetical protein